MYQLCVKEHFDAAHFLEGYVGKCHELHGHRWEVEVVLTGPKLDKINMLIDFKVVKACLAEIFDKYLDHHCLNETLQPVSNPTAEFLAKWIYHQFFYQLEMTHKNVCLVSVTVWESPECAVVYSENV